MRRVFLAIALLFILCATLRGVDTPATQPTTQPTTQPATDHRVLIISIDGLRPDVLLRADAPRLHKLMDEGSFTMWARTTAIAITLPSHTSMLTGVPPEVHGVTWNDAPPLAALAYPKVPTLFELAHEHGYTTAITTGKAKFVTLAKPGTVDWSFIPPLVTITDADVAEHAVQIIKDHHPAVLFVHLPDVDLVGHANGWGSAAQLAEVAKADKAVGQVLDAIDDQARAATLIIVTADHGGQGKSHGPDDARSAHIPWLLAGPGVRHNYDLTQQAELQVDIEDTFATACDWLAIPMPHDVKAKSILKHIPREH